MKKVLSLTSAVVAAMSLGICTGCGDDDDDSPSTPPPAPTSISGTFIINDNSDTVNGNPATDAFDSIEGLAVTFTVTFTVRSTSETDDTSSGGGMITTAAITVDSVTFAGAPSSTLGLLAANLQGVQRDMELESIGSSISLSTHIVGDTTAAESFGMELSASNVGVPLNANGYPNVVSFESRPANVILRRYASGTMTDYASGVATISMTIP